ncbi:DUF2153 domain-containing protein [Sulfuracidifex metallicus]|jgi:hypothetical protein|uniref:DUF2153 domain-containing protein n=1 Tax=Sulfuracidifex metallicus TaxID=47303 RepID=UPI000A43EC9F
MVSRLENTFLNNLDEWIKMQKNLLATLKEMEVKQSTSDMDRLDLVLASRTAFQHMIRTLKAFDQWLQDPMVIKHMPEEMLQDVKNNSWKLLEQLLELDIRHTSQFRELITKLGKDGKLDPLIWARVVAEESQQTQERRSPLSTI